MGVGMALGWRLGWVRYKGQVGFKDDLNWGGEVFKWDGNRGKGKMKYKILLISLVRGLTILHTNDIHSHYDQSNVNGLDCSEAEVDRRECYGGLARLKTAVDKLRKENPNNLFLDAGDQFQGTLFYGHYRGNVTWKAMNLLKYDAMTIGNHEFDDGADNFGRVARQFQFPVVCSNLDVSRHPTLKDIVKEYILFPEQGVAMVGFITPKTESIGTLGDKVTLKDTATSVQAAINKVNRLGYSRVIAMSHYGYLEDLALVKKLRGLSLIVGGHSHSYLAPEDGPTDNAPPSQGLYPTPVKDMLNETVYVVQAYCWARFLGRIDIHFNQKGYLSKITGNPVDLDHTVEQDPFMNQQVKEWRKPFDSYTQQVIGYANQALDRQSCYNQECALGDIVTDAMLDYRPNSHLAILNSGDIRTPINQGKVTIANILTALPYNSQIVQLNLTGSQLNQLIQGVITRTNPINHLKVTSFIQISHLRFTYSSLTKSLVSLELKKNNNSYLKIHPELTYSVATTDYIANNGNNLLPKIHPSPDQLNPLNKVVMDYFLKHSPIDPKPLDRIIDLDRPT